MCNSLHFYVKNYTQSIGITINMTATHIKFSKRSNIHSYPLIQVSLHHKSKIKFPYLQIPLNGKRLLHTPQFGSQIIT